MPKALATICGGALALAALAAPALAAWPNDRPIEIIVAFSPGGSTDVMARAMQPFLEKELAAKIVIVNKPGASGEIAYTYLSQARPDGYTFSFVNTPGYLSMQVQRKLRYDPKTIQVVARIVDDPTAFVVKADSPIKSLKDLVAQAKAKPRGVSVGSSGVGTDDHLAIILLEQATGTAITHVPFPGAGETRTALMGGHITVGGLNVSEFAAGDRTAVRPLATFGDKRSPEAPDVPTAAEEGFQVFMSSERGLAARREVPADILARFSAAVKKVVDDAGFREQAKKLALPLSYLTGPEWEQQMPVRLKTFQEIWDKTPWVQ
ncbi:MAG: tripartite tricarboxylate transporter substrate binding protein [Alphaproteobacteria bacterium]